MGGLLMLAASCVSTTSADLEHLRRDLGIPVSADAVPEGHRPIAALAYARTGFYFLGFLPVVSVELAAGVRKVVEQARALGATGIANLHYEYEPASSLRFVVFPLPDWSASLHVTATAYAPLEPVHRPLPRPPETLGEPAARPGR
ncbi:MAG: hypothetical protein R3F56_16845 [Planctomycetota bacterium]